MKLAYPTRRVLRAGGTTQALEGPRTMAQIEALIGPDCECCDTVMLDGVHVMIVDDLGYRNGCRSTRTRPRYTCYGPVPVSTGRFAEMLSSCPMTISRPPRFIAFSGKYRTCGSTTRRSSLVRLLPTAAISSTFFPRGKQ
ncbi:MULTISPECIES: hypothetical protein [unclassified Paraburkholderia]|uniref:hypothetical protein n=1 Tax=unclassified Paraburkholderia TaxID=2615204 RepID=UPI00179B8419|nr:MULTISPECIES: hypothetical protein [unclassified Paraburkholderia]MBB5442956.1 hypothetical protein [Paraburkholderia sp. WSM4177]MBB5483439.1 hypothetical protein [Paraburkholderia sp. WSM4180]